LLANLRIKLLALFFAAALWSVVAYTSNPTQSKTYQLPVESPKLQGLVVVGPLPQVTATAIGTADNLRNFDKSSLHLSANFAGVKVGANNVPIRVTSDDPAVSVDAPSSIHVTIDELASVVQNVSIERVHALPVGYHEQTSAGSITPPQVRIEGPKSQLSGVQAVVQVELDGMSPPGITAAQTVVIRDANKKLLPSMKATPAQVTVKIVIQADAITLTKPVGWTLTGQPAAGYRVSNVVIAPLEVQATGLQNALGQIRLLLTDPIDIGGAKSDVVKTVTIRPPEGVEVNQKTAQVHVFISPAPGVSPSPGP
jgi:YbbR domain-containing protein